MDTITNTTIQPQPQIKKDNKWLLWGLIGFTIILLITAIILFIQLKQPVPAPTPKPKASPQTVPVQQQQTEGVCTLSFTVTVSPSVSPSPSPSASPSPSVSPSPSASPAPIACFDTCVSDTECESGLRCMTIASEKRCVNPECKEDTDCSCTSPSPSASTQAQVSASPAASQIASVPRASVAPAALPQAGGNTPLVLGISAGILMMILGLLF